MFGGFWPVLLGWLLLSEESTSHELYTLICSSPLILLTILAVPLFEESAVFLASQGKSEKADKIFRKYATSRNKKLPARFIIKDKYDEKLSKLNPEKKFSYTACLLYTLKSRKIMRKFICIVMIGTTTIVTSLGSNFIANKLLVLLGELGFEYEDRDREHQSFNLSPDNYWKFLVFQLTGVVPLVALAAALKAARGKIRQELLSVEKYSHFFVYI